MGRARRVDELRIAGESVAEIWDDGEHYTLWLRAAVLGAYAVQKLLDWLVDSPFPLKFEVVEQKFKVTRTQEGA